MQSVAGNDAGQSPFVLSDRSSRARTWAHEVDIIHIADGQDGEEDNGNQGCRPKTTQGFEGDVSDEVAEEDARQEPYRH